MDLRLVPGLQQCLTPELRLMYDLFRQSAEELLEAIENEVTANPVLEKAGDRSDPGDADRVSPEPTSRSSGDDLSFDPRVLRQGPQERSLVALEKPEEREFNGVVAPPPTLAEHLEAGVRLAVYDPGLRQLALAIIGELDEDGYLREGLDEIAARCGVSAEDAERALETVQGLDPPGVAARSLQECLLLQLRQAPSPDPVAIEVVAQHWDDLLQGRLDRIARDVGQPRARVDVALEEVRRLDSRPGRAFSIADVQYLRPDVVVREVDGEWLVVLDDRWLPLLRLNRRYEALLDGPSDEAQRWVKARLRSARWFIRCIHRRQTTLRRVTECVMRVQRPFLEEGVAQLRPLSLRDVAEAVGVHESTISRLARQKYVDTPHGVFELRRFFTHAVPTQDGVAVSVDSALEMIKAMVAGEDPTRPLSDVEITAGLMVRGLAVKRRTVAKYRETLGIAKASVRRRRRGGPLCH
jgi:RNA polymerase sigma-54 factor